MMQFHDFIPCANATLASKQKHTVDVEDCLLPLPAGPGQSRHLVIRPPHANMTGRGQRETAMREKICNLSPKSISSPAETEEQRPQVFQWHMCSMIRNQSRNGEALSIDAAECHFLTLAPLDTSAGRCCRKMGTIWGLSLFDSIPTKKGLTRFTHCLFCQLIMPSFGKTINQTYSIYFMFICNYDVWRTLFLSLSSHWCLSALMSSIINRYGYSIRMHWRGYDWSIDPMFYSPSIYLHSGAVTSTEKILKKSVSPQRFTEMTPWATRDVCW